MITNKDREGVVDFLIVNYNTKDYTSSMDKLIGKNKINFLNALRLQLSEYTSKRDTFSISGKYKDETGEFDYSSALTVCDSVFSFTKYNSRLEFLNALESVLATFDLPNYEKISLISLNIDGNTIDVDLESATYSVKNLDLEVKECDHTHVPFGINSAVAGACLKESAKATSTLKTIKDIIAGD